jgi:chemotaxis protein MotB
MMRDPLDLSVPSPPPAVGPGWMITFADLLSLLLSFFVLLFATTTIDHGNWTRVMRPVSLYFGAKPPVVPGPATPAAAPQAELDVAYLAVALRQLAAQDRNLAGASVTEEDHRTILALPPQLLPCRGARAAAHAFDGLATLIGNVDNRIEVLGHGGIDPTAKIGPVAWLDALAVADRIATELEAAGVAHALDRGGSADLPGGSSTCAADIVFLDEPLGGAGGG